MDINYNLNEVINYIEDNLCGKIEYDKAAQILGLSEFHFQRVFSFLTGIPIAEYIRSRKMALAALDIKKKNIKVIDIAVKYGYMSHSSFSRSFKRYHGISPNDARMENVSVKTYPPITFNINIGKHQNIDFRIEKTESFDMFGKSDVYIPENLTVQEIEEIIEEYGNEILEDGTHDLVNVAAGFKPGIDRKYHLLHGIYHKDNDGKTLFMYGWDMPDKGVGEDFKVVKVPEATWAVFSYVSEGEEAAAKIWTFIHSNWLKTSGYKKVDSVFLDRLYYLDDAHRKFLAEVWLPIEKEN